MKRFWVLITVAVTALACTMISLTACTETELAVETETAGSGVANSDVIGFTVASTKGTEVTTSTLSEFYVTAYNGTAEYFSDVKFTGTSGGSFTSDPAYLWPGDGSTVAFYAYYPSQTDMGGKLTIEADTQTLEGYTPSTTISSQKDIIFATTTGKSTDENSPSLSFSHALAEVNISAKNDGTSYTCSVKGIQIANVISSGDYDISEGTWDTTGSGKTTYTITYDDAVTVSTSATSLMGTAGAAFLIPQTLTAWDPEGTGTSAADKTNTSGGAYIAVYVDINDAISDDDVYPTTSNTYDWVSIPISGTWGAGSNAYSYVLDFSSGAGYYPPTDASTPGEPIIGDSAQDYVIDSTTGAYTVYTAKGLMVWNKAVTDSIATNGTSDLGCTLAADIDMKDLDNDNTVTEKDWIVVGTGSSNYYNGTFDGAGFTISNLKAGNSSSDYQGMFGYINGGTVEDLTLDKATITGGGDVGGIVGYIASSGKITNCQFTSGTVTGSGNYVGGVAGSNSLSPITSCTVSGATITGSGNYVGGVAGDNSTGAISGCTFTGVKVTGSGSNVGGVAGYSSGTISDCYSVGNVSGGSYVGGVVGYNYNSGRGEADVTACYAVGDVSGSSYVGGVVGYNRGNGYVTACYYASGTLSYTGNDNTLGGVVGYNGSSVSYCYYTASDKYYGVGGAESDTESVTTAVSSSGWSSAMSAMNETLENLGYQYRYTTNSDGSTSSTIPLVLTTETE